MYKVKDIAIIAIIGAVAVSLAKNAVAAIGSEMVGDGKLDITSKNNFAYGYTDNVFKSITEDGESIGDAFYRWLHPEDEPEAIKEKVISDLKSEGIDYYDVTSPGKELVYYGIDPISGATIYPDEKLRGL